MKRYMILSIVIFACIFCARKAPPNSNGLAGDGMGDSVIYDDYDNIREHYYKILLTKWPENANSFELSGKPFFRVEPAFTLYASTVTETSEKVLKKYYRIASGMNGFIAHMALTDDGYWQVRLLRRIDSSKQEQIWILISATDGKFRSTCCRDTVTIAKKSKVAMRAEEQDSDSEKPLFELNEIGNLYEWMGDVPTLLKYERMYPTKK